MYAATLVGLHAECFAPKVTNKKKTWLSLKDSSTAPNYLRNAKPQKAC